MINKYKDLDKLKNEQDLFLALAVYDWFWFNDTRLFGLKQDYKVTTGNKDIYIYYYTERGYVVKINHDRYTRMYKELLQEVLI